MIFLLKKIKKLVPSAIHRPSEYLMFSMMQQGGAECRRIGIPKRQDVVAPVQHVTFNQRFREQRHFGGQPFEIEVR